MHLMNRLARKRDSGQNLVEFALVAVLLLALVLGIVEFGRVWMTFQVVTNAAREGARLAALPTGFTNAGAVTAKVNDYLTSAGLDTGVAGVTAAGVDGATGTNATVTVTYNVEMLFLGPIVGLLDSSSSIPGSFTLTGTSTMRNE
jgi:Flp pilus assembly protein TadG